jgi:Flavodoxin domain
MSVLVIYESMWGNTRDVAQAIGEGLGGRVTVTEVQVAPRHVPEGVDLVVLGGPTHAFSMSRSSTRHDAVKQGATVGDPERGIREWLADQTTTSDRLDIATFDTRVTSVRHLPGSAAKGAAKEVRRHHLGHLIGTESFYVSDTAGPLLEGEIERARAWGAELATTDRRRASEG